jgi:predicted Zn-dependent protease
MNHAGLSAFHDTTTCTAVAMLVARARKHRRRGEMRKALTALREACARDEEAAWLWTMYGALLASDGKANEAAGAFRHALWLRRTAGDASRVRSTQALLERLAA